MDECIERLFIFTFILKLLFFSGLVCPFLTLSFGKKIATTAAAGQKTRIRTRVEAQFKIHVDDQRSIKFAANTNLDQFNMLFFILCGLFLAPRFILIAVLFCLLLAVLAHFLFWLFNVS